MNEKEFKKQLTSLGFPLLEIEESVDANATLAHMVKSKQIRLWEGFPVVLANSVNRNLFSCSQIIEYFDDPKELQVFRELLTMSLALYGLAEVNYFWIGSVMNESGISKDDVKVAQKKLKSTRFTVSVIKISLERLENIFKHYHREQREELQDLISFQEELKLERDLSQIFSPKQKELFFKKLRREKMTKTEKEYYSRVVKKKVAALANEELYILARNLLEKK